MKVIGFCGLPGSGKSTAIEAVKHLGLIVNMGDIIRNETKIRNIEPNDDNLGKIAKELREKGGEEIIAVKCVELITNMKANVIFIDGIRSIAEVKVFRRYWKFPLIEIETNKNLRYKRISNRARRDDSRIINEISEREKREIGFGLKEVIRKADYKIKNNSTIKYLKIATLKLVLEIVKSY